MGYFCGRRRCSTAGRPRLFFAVAAALLVLLPGALRVPTMADTSRGVASTDDAAASAAVAATLLTRPERLPTAVAAATSEVRSAAAVATPGARLEAKSAAAAAAALYTPRNIYCCGHCGLGDGLGNAHFHALSALIFGRPVVSCYTNASTPTEDDILLVITPTATIKCLHVGDLGRCTPVHSG